MSPAAGRGHRAQVLRLQKAAYVAAGFAVDSELGPEGFVFLRRRDGVEQVVSDRLMARDIRWAEQVVAVVHDAVEDPLSAVSPEDLRRRHTAMWELPTTKRFGKPDKALTSSLAASSDLDTVVSAHVQRVLELAEPWWAGVADLDAVVGWLRKETADLVDANPEVIAHRIVAERVAVGPQPAAELFDRWQATADPDDWLDSTWTEITRAALARLDGG